MRSVLLLLSFLACAAPSRAPISSSPSWSVGHTPHVLTDRVERPLTVEVWFPTDAPGAPAEAIQTAYLADTAEQGAYAALLAAAPTGCPSTETRSQAQAPLAAGIWPVVVLSHCHSCVRFSNLTIAEGLAQAGFVVVAPDHAGNTLFDDTLSLSTETLVLRREDLGRALDALLGGELGLDPTQLRGDAVGALGHSFGSVSVGLLAQEDPRIAAAVGIAAPMESPLPAGVDLAALGALPLLFLVAGEDNSITELGNDLIRANFDAAAGPAWKVEVADAGHWSFSDVCGLTEDFMPGCGEDDRQTQPDETFTYLPPDETRALASTLSVAFFSETLRGQVGAIEAALEVIGPAWEEAGLLSVAQHPE